MKLLILLHVLFFYCSMPDIAFSSPACNFPAIINFGDSNSDTGGFSAAFGPFPPPNGESFFHMPAGRLSDGRLIIDFIAKSFGLPFLSSYLDSLGANYSHGVDFATVSSTIIDQNISLSQGGYSPFYLAVQVMQFSQFVPRSQLVAKRGGCFKSLMPKKEYFNQSLYTIDIGQNDITAGLGARKTSDKFIPQTLAVFSGEVKRIYNLGARYFWIHNTGPLGCLAYTLVLRNLTAAGELDPAGCSVFYNKVAQQFNKKLNETLVELRKQLPRAVITYVDIYSAKYSLFLKPAKYGFKDPLRVCCGHGNNKYNFDPNVLCGSKATVNGSVVLLGRSCREPSKKVVWDGIHYTDAANKVVFDLISTGRFSHPPRSLKRACEGRIL
ncbi:GDSL esterase/lipase At3g26430-like [Dendrobium catenatum]|uniref:GDSL esterase/lipase n=1 Tax=Dendrobium catenatum TaxID=906689 RepID=A0A2I0WXC0_9ASPA|nr:GDSL esterase/lipase At3g26430-like [Dendrobium catenatum]PKU80313.1 GDSL esterase/lipase [Dendrobium catenatum]